MTEVERQAVARAIQAINSLADSLEIMSGRLRSVELAVVAIHKRLKLYEAGENEIVPPVRAH